MKALPLFGVWGATRTSGAIRRWRVAAPLFTAALLFCGLAGSDAHLGMGVAASVIPNRVVVPETAPAVVHPVEPPKLLVVRGHEIDALVGVVARKYRVSQTAAREFVATAYHEGWRLGLDPILIVAVMAVESGFNPVAESDGGAIGLMQVIPRFHADKLAEANGVSVLDPHLNIQLGARVLKEYIERAGTEIAGLQLYNGSSADATNAYATRVLREKQRFLEAIRRPVVNEFPGLASGPPRAQPKNQDAESLTKS